MENASAVISGIHSAVYGDKTSLAIRMSFSRSRNLAYCARRHQMSVQLTPYYLSLLAPLVPFFCPVPFPFFLPVLQESRGMQTVVMQGADGKREKKKKTDVLEMDGYNDPLSLLCTTHCTPCGNSPCMHIVS